MQIEFRGNAHTNSSSRINYTPVAIVNHVVAGSGSSCDNWFRSANNKVSSAHFCVWEDGRITQYVDLKRMAWANGLKTTAIKNAKSSLVKSRRGVNPNLYTISIEHAGHTGKLTEKQFQATVYLHKWIQKEVKRLYNHTIPLDRTHVLGHFEIDPIRKPNCPGPEFPWTRLMAAIQGQDKPRATSPGQIGIATVIQKEPLPCRKSPSPDGTFIKNLAPGTGWRVYGKKDGFYKVGENMWISANEKRVKYQEVLPYVDERPVIGIVQVLVDDLNLRDAPNFTTSKVIRQLDKGTRWKAYKLENGLYQVGINQWVTANTKYVKFTKN